LNQPVNNQVLKDQIRRVVVTIFADCGVSYRNPTKKGILEAIGKCKANAEEMMGSQGRRIIKHHYKEIMKLVNRLPD
jgi:hypothetical protein